MPNSTRSTRSRNAKVCCQACNDPDNDQMVSCNICGSRWHSACVNYSDISGQDLAFVCPKCQKSPAVVHAAVSSVGCKSLNKAGSKTSSISTRASSRTKKARLQLEQLEAQKALAMKRLELELREQERKLEHQTKEAEVLLQHRLEQEKQRKEIEIEQRQLELEQTILEESFRLREIIALDDDEEEDDGKSVISEQSTFSKVNKWKTLSSTMVASTGRVHETGLNNDEAATGTRMPYRQKGTQHPSSITQGVLETALAGISLGQSYLEPSLGGLIGRTENTILPVVTENPLFVSQPANPIGSTQLATNNISQTNILLDPARSSFSQQPTHNCPPAVAHPGGVCQRNEEEMLRRPLPPRTMDGYVPTRTQLEQRLPISFEPQRSFGQQQHSTIRQNREQPESSELPADWEGPSARQLAARQVMARDLPTFSGNPEDWPLFISSYNNSTRACGFSDVENLTRLQRCLKGHALESVRSRLLMPAGVPHVIATLETLYGRPELIIHTLLQKIRNVPSPKQDRLETLIAFGMAVQNLSDHLEAGRQLAHLNNPMLLFELVEKLPAHMKLDWSLYKQRFADANLRTFSQYMQTLVRAATDVTMHYDPTQNLQRMSKEKLCKEKTFCGAHSKDDTLEGMSREEEDQDMIHPVVPACLICKNPDHRVKDCVEFDRKTIDERWKLTQQLGLCRLCLGAHGKRPCKVRKQCDFEGCQRRHHPLLHSCPDPRDVRTNSKPNEVNAHKDGDDQTSCEIMPSGSQAITNHHSTDKKTLFRIIPVTLYGNNRSISVYAFLDDGTEKTLIDEEVIKELGVVGEPQKLCLQWTANVKRAEINSKRVNLEISGNNPDTRHLLTGARTVRNLDLPKQSLRFAELAREFPYLKGIPVEGYRDAIPKILIGNDNAHVTSTLKIRDGQPGEPIAAKTRLGWTIYGYNQDNLVGNTYSFHIREYALEKTIKGAVGLDEVEEESSSKGVYVGDTSQLRGPSCDCSNDILITKGKGYCCRVRGNLLKSGNR